MQGKARIEIIGLSPLGLSKEDRNGIRESFDDSVLERYQEKTFTYPEVKQDLVDLARDWTKSVFVRFVNLADDPRRGYVEAVRNKEKFTIWTWFNESGQIRRMRVYYSRSLVKELWEMSREELLEHRRKQAEFEKSAERYLQTIEFEVQRRGLC